MLFKALADDTRLKIIGMLSHTCCAVETLASGLRRSPSTISHHLAVLGSAGLVRSEARGYYRIYSLDPGPLHTMARALLRRSPAPVVTQEGDAFERKVLGTFLAPDGGIRAFPTQEKKYLVLVRHVLKAFEPGIRYTEKQVNQILGRFNEDTARLRRSLVDHRYMAREGGGGKYWRLPLSPE